MQATLKKTHQNRPAIKTKQNSNNNSKNKQKSPTKFPLDFKEVLNKLQNDSWYAFQKLRFSQHNVRKSYSIGVRDEGQILSLFLILILNKMSKWYKNFVLCALEISRDVQNPVKKDLQHLLLNRKVGLEGLKRSLLTK